MGALSGSLAAYLLGLVVQYLRRPRKIIGYFMRGRRIAERKNPKLVVRYQDREIERMHSYTIELHNIGNQALKDVPITIQCPAPAEIVEYDLSAPRGSRFVHSLEGPQVLNVRCDLLNRREKTTIGVTTINSKGERSTDDVIVSARQEDLECRTILPLEWPFTNDPVTRALYKIGRIFIR